MANMFDKARGEAPVQEEKKKSSKKRPSYEQNGAEQFAAVDALIKQLEAVKESLEEELKSGAKKQFVKNGMATQTAPQNFDYTEATATVGVQLKKRSSRSLLSESEREVLTDAGVSYETETTQEETFLINPKYATDSKMLEKVAKALDGVVPEDFIQHQDKVQKHSVGASTINEVFSKIQDMTEVEALLDIVSTLALKPTTTETDLNKLLKKVMG